LGGKATFDDKEARITIAVERVRVAQEVFRDDSLELKEAIAWVPEPCLGVVVGVHHARE